MSHGFDSIYDLDADDQPIVIASSIRGGRIMGTHCVGTPIIIANDLPANKARILLMLALTMISSMTDIQKMLRSILNVDLELRSF